MGRLAARRNFGVRASTQTCSSQAGGINVCVDSNDGFNQGFAARAKPFD
jgi:hypothetical protein